MERAGAFGVRRRFGLGIFRRRTLIRSPLALERFFIAFPRSPGGMVSGRRPMPEVVYFGVRQPSRCQPLQQRLRVHQITGAVAFREPLINRSQQFARLLHLAHGRADGGRGSGFSLVLTRTVIRRRRRSCEQDTCRSRKDQRERSALALSPQY